MDAGIVKMDGEHIFSCCLVAYGSDPGTGKRLIADLVKRGSKIGKPLVINPIILIPPGTDEVTISRTLIDTSDAVRGLGVIVGKGHTEITSRVAKMTLVATLLGSF
jgi:hydrogenase maturation factor